jgi:hypothetical protein
MTHLLSQNPSLRPPARPSFLQFSPFRFCFHKFALSSFILENGPLGRRRHYWRGPNTCRRQFFWRLELVIVSCVALLCPVTWLGVGAIDLGAYPRHRDLWRRPHLYGPTRLLSLSFCLTPPPSLSLLPHRRASPTSSPSCLPLAAPSPPLRPRAAAAPCHTQFWKVKQMRTIYVSGSEIHVHNDYIIGHHHTLLKIIVEISTLSHHGVQNIHKVIKLSHNQSAE